MSAEPEKFHVSMIDFFSIILPGAVMTFYLRTAAEKSVVPAVFPAPKSEVEGWVIFAVASYILGHFLFLSGSWLHKGYDAFRKTFYPNEKNIPLRTALKIKKANPTLEQLDDEAINASSGRSAAWHLRIPRPSRTCSASRQTPNSFAASDSLS